MKNLYTLVIVCLAAINIVFSQSYQGNAFDTWSASQKFLQFNENHIFVFGSSDFETWTNSRGFVHFSDDGELSPFIDIQASDPRVQPIERPDSLDQLRFSVKDVQSGNDIKTSTASKIFVYPNPAIEKLNININLPTTSDVKITLFNSIGNIISQTELKDKRQVLKTLDVGDIKRGIYFLEIKSDGIKTIKKIVLK